MSTNHGLPRQEPFFFARGLADDVALELCEGDEKVVDELAARDAAIRKI